MKDLLSWARKSPAKEQCNEKAETEPHGGVQGEGGLGGAEGRQDAGGAGGEVRRARQPDHAMEDTIAGRCDRGVHVAGRETRYRERPDGEGDASQNRAARDGSRVFWKSRSVASAMRAQSDDRQGTRAVSSTRVFSPRIAARATVALNFSEWFLRGRFMVCSSATTSPIRAELPLIRLSDYPGPPLCRMC